MNNKSIEKNSNQIWTRDFILLCLGSFIMSVSFYFLIPTLPVYIVSELKEPNSSVGITLASFALAALLIRPFSGFAVDSWGRKFIYLGTFVFFSLVFGLYLLASNIHLLFMVRFLHGLVWGVVSTAGAVIAVDLIPPKKRGEGLGYFGLAMTVAMSVGPLIGLMLCQDHHYQRLFMIAFALSFAGFFLAAMVKYPKFNKPSESKKLSLANMFEKTSFPASVNVLVIMSSYGGIISFISIYGKECGVNNAGLFFMLSAAGLGISRILSGKVFDSFGPKKVILFGVLFLVTGFIILALFKNAFGFHLAATILGFGYGIIIPVFQAMVNNMAGHDKRGAANSTIFTAFDIGIGAGMVITGILADVSGLSTSFIIFAMVCLLGGLHFYFHVYPHYMRHSHVREAEDEVLFPPDL